MKYLRSWSWRKVEYKLWHPRWVQFASMGCQWWKGSRTINYASVVGMLLYLTGHSRLDCAFAMNQCAHYIFAPTQKYECALIQFSGYLKGTLDKGLVLSPSNTLHIDWYPNMDFAWLARSCLAWKGIDLNWSVVNNLYLLKSDLLLN